MLAMHYEADELLNEAIMTKLPILVVEGRDDVDIYDRIVSGFGLSAEIYPVELVSGYSEGCNQVVSLFQDLENSNLSVSISDHILGIIDKDVRDFREEIPNYKSVFVLKYYSIESHFICEDAIRDVLLYATFYPESGLKKGVVNSLWREVEAGLLSLYLGCLEALKAATQRDYKADLSYSHQSLSQLEKDEILRGKIESKRDDLLRFASKKGLSNEIECLLSIGKGKWMLDAMSENILRSLSNLPNECKNGKVNQCNYCNQKTYEKCLYKMRPGVTKDAIKISVIKGPVRSQFKYIADRIRELKFSFSKD